MDRVSNDELFSTIHSSNILLPYLPGDPELSVLLEYPNHCNIHYPRNYATVHQVMPVLRDLLAYMSSKRIYLNIEATKQLIRFGEKRPDGHIYDITFNCDRQSYGVCCGRTEEQLRAICVLTGAHIPDEFFGEAAS